MLPARPATRRPASATTCGQPRRDAGLWTTGGPCLRPDGALLRLPTMAPWRTRADRGLLRPRQDDHRQVEHAGVQQALPGGRPDLARARCCARRTPSSSTSSAAPTTTRWRRCGSSCRSSAPAGTSPPCARSSPTPCTTSSTRSCTTRRSRLIEEHQLAGRDVVIVSTSGAEVVEPIGEMLGADRVIATRMEIVDGQVHRRASSTTRTPRRRRARSRSWPASSGYDLDALLRLQRLGHRRAHARGGRPPARRQPRQGAAQGRGRAAAGRCWSSPSRSPCAPGCRCPPAKPTLAALAVGGVVAVGGVDLGQRPRAADLGA